MNNRVKGLGFEKMLRQWEGGKSANGFKVLRRYQGKVLRGRQEQETVFDFDARASA
jgi:hypothetical protein